MKAVVVGGAGFLGSFVADALTDAGNDVVLFDRVPSPWLRPEQRMIVGDILDSDKVSEAVRDAQVVYHYAGIADIEEARQKPVETVRVNVLGTTMLLEAARLAGVQRFVFASTLYVYGDAGSFYRSTKQACELIIEEYERAFGLAYTVLRYGSLYGPRASATNWIQRTLTEALTLGRVVRYGDGEEIREYIHVWDAARSSVDVLSPEYENSHVVITGNQSMRIRDLLAMVREMVGNRLDVEYRPPDHPEAPHDSSLHYQVTPYQFNPKTARKLVRTSYVDLGQGLLDLMHGIHREHLAHPPAAQLASDSEAACPYTGRS